MASTPPSPGALKLMGFKNETEASVQMLDPRESPCLPGLAESSVWLLSLGKSDGDATPELILPRLIGKSPLFLVSSLCL